MAMLGFEQFQCDNCHIIFTQEQHLHTHKIKFCKDVEYVTNQYSRSNVNSRHTNKSGSVNHIPYMYVEEYTRSENDDEDSLTYEVKQKMKERERAQLLSELKLLEQEEDKLVQLSRYQRPPSQQKQLIQYKDIYKSNVTELDQFTIDHGKKMAQIKVKREGLERHNENIDRRLEEKHEERNRLGANQYGTLDIKSSNVSNMSDKRKGLNQSEIRQRKHNLEKLQEEYRKIGGDDPSFYNSIARLQSKYNLEARRHPEVAPTSPPENNWMLPFPSRQILPEGSFSSYKPLLIGDTLNKEQTIEQRVVASIMAQQYDSLQILAKIPKDSELYKIKLQQYKELSKYRQDALKQAHLQRLRKLKNQFEIQRKLDIKQLNNDRWVNDMRKNIIGKVKKTGPSSKEKMSCGVFIHMVKGMPKSVYQIRVNFKVIQHSEILLEDDTLGERESKYSVTDGKAVSTFNEMINLSIEDKRALSILVEISCNSISGRDFRHLGWTLVKLTNNRKCVIENNYKLPVFQYPIDYNLYLNQGNARRVFPEMFVYMKVFEQEINNYRDYVEPRYNSQELYLNDQQQDEMKPSLTMPPNANQLNKSQINQKKNTVGFKSKEIGASNRGYAVTIVSINTTQNPEDLLLEVLILADETVLHDQNDQPIRLQLNIDDQGQRHYNKKQVRLNEVLRVNIDLQRLYSQLQRELYLMMILKDKNLEDKENIVGWNCYKLTNFHKVREGDAVVRLVKDQLSEIPFDMNLAEEQTEEEIHIRMDWVEIGKGESRSSKRTRK